MRVIILILLTIIYIIPCYADDKVTSAVCGEMSGQVIEVLNGKVEEEKHKASNTVTYIFIYDEGKIVDSRGGEYVMFVNSSRTITGFNKFKSGGNFLTFYPKDNRIISSMHIYMVGNPSKVDIHAQIMTGKCDFK